MPDVNVQGADLDLATAEIQVDGRPLLYGFSSLGWKRTLTREFVWWNGSDNPQGRTSGGKAEPSMTGEMPAKNHALLVNALGGSGADGLAHMRKPFTVTLLFRPTGASTIYRMRFEQVVITSEDGKNEHGSKSTVSLELMPMRIIGPEVTS